MSRGLGARQSAILMALEENGPMVVVDLVAKLWRDDGGATIPPSFYESIRRAAASLVAKGKVLSGAPEYPPRYRERAREILWLSGQPTPDLRRTIPKNLFEHAILKALASGPQAYSHVVNVVLSGLARDQAEYDRLRGSISLAVKRLEARGEIRRYQAVDEFGSKYLSVVM